MATLNDLLDAIKYVESGGNNSAISPKGALGPYQFMPATAKEYGLQGNDVFDETKARLAAQKKVTGLLDRYGGNVEHAVAAYNLGEGNMSKLNNQYHKIPETKNYVQKVLSMLNPISSANADEKVLSEEEWNALKQQSAPKQSENHILTEEEWNALKSGGNAKSMTGTTGSWEPEHNNSGLASIGKAAVNFVPNLVNEVVPGVANTIIHPIDTLQGGLNLANSAMQKVLPEGLVKLMYKINPETEKNTGLINQAGDALMAKYGSPGAIKNTFENRPASMLMDVSALLSGTGALTKSAKLSELGNVINPLSLTGSAIENGIGYLAPKLGNAAAIAVGDLGTHTGADSIKEAAKAGMQGGQKQSTLIENMRGNVPMSDAIEAAKTNLNELRRIKNAEYKANITATTNDSSVLSLNGVKKTISDALDDVTFNGIPKNQKAFDTLKKIQKDVDSWDKRPDNFKTPEGLDALKQRIGALKESLPADARTAHKYAGDIYNSIKNEIVNKSPIYAQTMNDYWRASDEIMQMEKTLSLGNKATIDTSLRKLQSIMRNNANSNYGNRLELLKQLEEKGGNDVITALAGQSLTAKAPRGIAGALTLGSGAGGYLLGGPAGALGTLAVQSPRLMGEAALKVGQSARGVKKLSQYAKKGNKGNLSAYLYELGNNDAKR